MNKITALNAFRRVVELGTFKGAADDLHLSQAAVSKNINELEEFLGIALINRTTRRMSVTESGIAYYRQIIHILDKLEAADQSIMSSSFAPKGRLRIGVPMSFGLMKINPLICDFGRSYPDIIIEVVLSDVYVDLIDSGIDVVIRGGNGLVDSTLRSGVICEVKRVLCASPEYLTASGQLAHPEDLRLHNCLDYSLSSSPRKWYFTRDAENVEIELGSASYSANNGIALKQAAIHGLGIILIPKEYVAQDLAVGNLVEVLSDWKAETHSLFVVYPYHKELSQKVRLFIDFIKGSLSTV